MKNALRHDLLVLDASVGYHLFVPQPGQSHLQSLLSARLADRCDFVAPTLWRYEVTSTLTKALQQRQLTQAETASALAHSLSFPIRLMEPDGELARAAFDWTVKLQRVAAYDSFYLALAQQLQCELWTYDKRLANAVSEPWVHYLG
jgi:predicted nucleic acid-binding protein